MSNSNLYGRPKAPKQQSTSTTPSSSTLAFTTTLSNLISADNANSSRHGRPRPSKTTKSDLFARPNKGAQKRAAADLNDSHNNAALQQAHQSSAEIGTVDAATLHRSKRRMEEKTRLYEDLKRGEYLAAGSESDDEDSSDAYLARLRRKEKEALVDFDRKWADEQQQQEEGVNASDDSSSEKEADDNASIISYEDELGRTRRGTRKEASRAAREKAALASRSTSEPANERWRPSRPENLIYGATVQTEAFRPPEVVAEQMEYLAKRRDRSMTPEEVHYDAEGEVRNRGMGFYAFSKDEEVRRRQMEELMSARAETERERQEKVERRNRRERAREERRREVDKLRAKRRAEMFLSGLGDVGVSG
ncbi:hypothetical protein BJX61DRAFT_532230 [Aspergillus egyptiacus]|nr:hypothetical protein BJX61DRAFT_532230 [Aspergillus egyptiacus]